jgi:hypothetical protein
MTERADIPAVSGTERSRTLVGRTCASGALVAMPSAGPSTPTTQGRPSHAEGRHALSSVRACVLCATFAHRDRYRFRSGTERVSVPACRGVVGPRVCGRILQNRKPTTSVEVALDLRARASQYIAVVWSARARRSRATSHLQGPRFRSVLERFTPRAALAHRNRYRFRSGTERVSVPGAREASNKPETDRRNASLPTAQPSFGVRQFDCRLWARRVLLGAGAEGGTRSSALQGRQFAATQPQEVPHHDLPTD